MSSSTGCDAVSVSSQLDTYINEVQVGGTLIIIIIIISNLYSAYYKKNIGSTVKKIKKIKNKK